jgi:hypothetical protein
MRCLLLQVQPQLRGVSSENMEKHHENSDSASSMNDSGQSNLTPPSICSEALEDLYLVRTASSERRMVLTKEGDLGW